MLHVSQNDSSSSLVLVLVLISDRGERIRMNGNKWSNKFVDQEEHRREEKRPEAEEARTNGNEIEPVSTERR